MSLSPTFARVRVSGTPHARGVQHGTQARAQIEQGRAGYEQNFLASGISWPAAVEYALRYAPTIKERFPDISEELHGIAEGSGLPFADILAMNCRTEIMWHRANENRAAARLTGECSSFGLGPERTEFGVAIIGQNWDWLVHATNSVIVLEVERTDGPNYVTVVEAGLLAKFSLNQHGLAIGVNTLVTAADTDTDGIPFHVLLRALTDCQTTFDAVEVLAGGRRASSGNFLVGSADGAILNLECEPGGIEGVHPLPLIDGQVVHTNHFVSPTKSADLAVLQMSDSFVRLQRLSDSLERVKIHTEASIHAALTDHVGAPGSVCCHPDPRSPASKQWTSVASVIIDPTARTLALTEGSPCQTTRNVFDYSDLLGLES